MDKLKAMHTFVRIADAGSLTAASRELGSSLPAVVRSLAALEAHLGARLFNRTTRRISLTEEGKHYLARCRQVLQAVEEAETALSAEATEPNGLITVTAPVLFGQMHVAPAITRFVQRHDKVRVNLVLLDRVVNLLEEGIDLGVRIGMLEDSSLVALPLGRIRREVVASPGYLRRHGTPRHPRDLLQRNCLVWSTHPGAGWIFHAAGKRIVVPVSGDLESNEVAPLIAACIDGAGLGLFMSYQVAEPVSAKRLKIVLPAFEPPPRPVQLVYPHARLLPARVKALIEWLKVDLMRNAAWAALNKR